MTKKPVFVEVYAWNEPILGLVAAGWGLFLALLDFEPGILGERFGIGVFVACGGLALLLMQSERLRTYIDFRLPVTLVKVLPKALQPWILRVWPASTLCRLGTHFFFTVWWLLMAVAVSLAINSIEDVRLIFYFGFAALHFDRLMRLIQWVRA